MDYLIKNIEYFKDYVVLELISENGDNEKLKVHGSSYAEFFLVKGKCILDEEYQNIKSLSDVYFFKDEIIMKMKYHYYSEYQVRLLASNKFKDNQVNILIESLKSNGYLNDYEYVKKIFNEALNKSKGRLYIEDKLNNTGISEGLISKFYEGYKEYDIASKLAKKIYLENLNKLNKSKLVRKIVSKLNYNGFSEEIINSLAENYNNMYIPDNLDNLLNDYHKFKRKYEKKLKEAELKRKIIESLLAKGYNYSSVKNVINGSDEDD